MSSAVYSGDYPNGITLSNPGTQRTVTVTGTITNDTGPAIFGNPVFPWTISNSGTIHATGTLAPAIELDAGGYITNQAAVVGAGSHPAGLIEGYSGIAIDFGPGVVTNLGTVEATGTSQTAIALSGGGSVTNGSTAVTSAHIIGQRHAIDIDGGAATVTNFGMISTTGTNANIVLDNGGSVTNGSTASKVAKITGAGTGVYSQLASATVTNFGTIQSTADAGISLHEGGSVTNGSTSVASAEIIAVGTGIFIAGSTGTVANYGTIQTTSTSPAIAFESGGSVSNGASGLGKSLITASAGTGIYITGGHGTVTNYGKISSTSTAGGTTIVLREGGSIANHGTITEASTANAAVYLEITGSVTNGTKKSHTALISGAGTGVSIHAGRGTVTNYGSITSSTDAGVYLHSGGVVNNKAGGRITGYQAAVAFAGGTGTVVNLGTIELTGSSSAGVDLVDGGKVTNGSKAATTALISGAAGVYFKANAATLINFGTVTGEIGFFGTGLGAHTVINYGTITNLSGTAGVALEMSSDGGQKLVVVEAGAVFTGLVLGGGNAEIDFVGGGTAVLANISGFKTIKFDDGVAHTATLTNENATGVSGYLTVIGGDDGNTIDASAVTSNGIIFEGSTGTDTYTGGSGGDIFEFSASELTASDTLNGGGGLNQLVMSSAGTIAAAGVEGMEIIRLASGAANTLTLTDANFTNVVGVMAIYDGNNGDTINGSALATASHDLLIYGGSGTEHLSGGAGSDIFVFSASALVSTDTVSGGGGSNTLLLTTPGAPNVTGVTGIETYALADGGANTLTLTNANFSGVAGGTITVDDGNGGTTFSASGLSAAHNVTVYAGSGADTITGGAGNDVFYAGGDTTMTGGGGADEFIFTGVGTNTVTDFTHSTDSIAFSDAGFSLGLAGASSTPTALPSTLFTSNSTGSFTTAAERFAYDTTTGALFYDAGGSSTPGAAQLVATLSSHPTLTASDLFYIT